MNKQLIKDFAGTFWDFIPQFHRFMHNYYKKKSEFPLNKNKKKALMTIYRMGEMHMSQLGECIELQKGSLTTLIDSLEQEGYIQRLPLDNDRRKTILSLTKKGGLLIKNRRKEMKEYIQETFRNVSTEEMEELVQSLETVTGIFKKL